MNSLGFSLYKILSSINRERFTSFLIPKPFILFYCLNSLARTYITMLNRSIRSEYFYIVLDLRGNNFSLSLWTIMLAVDFSYIFYIRLKKFHSIPSLLIFFNHERLMNYVKCFSVSSKINMQFLPIILLIWCITSIFNSSISFAFLG